MTAIVTFILRHITHLFFLPFLTLPACIPGIIGGLPPANNKFNKASSNVRSKRKSNYSANSSTNSNANSNGVGHSRSQLVSVRVLGDTGEGRCSIVST